MPHAVHHADAVCHLGRECARAAVSARPVWPWRLANFLCFRRPSVAIELGLALAYGTAWVRSARPPMARSLKPCALQIDFGVLCGVQANNSGLAGSVKSHNI